MSEADEFTSMADMTLRNAPIVFDSVREPQPMEGTNGHSYRASILGIDVDIITDFGLMAEVHRTATHCNMAIIALGGDLEIVAITLEGQTFQATFA